MKTIQDLENIFKDKTEKTSHSYSGSYKDEFVDFLVSKINELEYELETPDRLMKHLGLLLKDEKNHDFIKPFLERGLRVINK